MVVDVEITLNRFGFYRPARNKLQVGFLRLSLWTGIAKYALSFEINWKPREQCPATESGGVRCEKKKRHWGKHACPRALRAFLGPKWGDPDFVVPNFQPPSVDEGDTPL